jgi:hypothetical protein
VTDRAIALELSLEHGRTVFEPGARLSGIAAWSARAAPSGMELRLGWVAQGPGGRDLKIVETIPLREPLAVERRPFILTLPSAPYSFRGGLISLTWTLDLVAQPGDDKARIALTIAPGRQAIDLRKADTPPSWSAEDE